MKKIINGRLLLITIAVCFYSAFLIAKTVQEVIKIPPLEIYEKEVLASLEKEGIIRRSTKQTYHISSYYRKYIKPLRSFPRYKLIGISILLCKYNAKGHRELIFDHMYKNFKHHVGPQCQKEKK